MVKTIGTFFWLFMSFLGVWFYVGGLQERQLYFAIPGLAAAVGFFYLAFRTARS